MAEFWLEKPVIAINTATYWHALRTMGFTDQKEGFGRLLLALQGRGATCGLQSVQAVGFGGEVHFRRFTEYSVLKALPYEAQFFGRQRKTIEGARDQLAERVQRA
jgi:hypothetical protein